MMMMMMMMMMVVVVVMMVVVVMVVVAMMMVMMMMMMTLTVHKIRITICDVEASPKDENQYADGQQPSGNHLAVWMSCNVTTVLTT